MVEPFDVGFCQDCNLSRFNLVLKYLRYSDQVQKGFKHNQGSMIKIIEHRIGQMQHNLVVFWPLMRKLLSPLSSRLLETCGKRLHGFPPLPHRPEYQQFIYPSILNLCKYCLLIQGHHHWAHFSLFYKELNGLEWDFSKGVEVFLDFCQISPVQCSVHG